MKYKGTLLTEITKGSLDYQRMEIIDDFREAFPEQPNGPYLNVEEVFTDHLIVSLWGAGCDTAPDEFFQVDFSQDAQGENVFAPQPWPLVELTYQTATPTQTLAPIPGEMDGMMGESKKHKGMRLTERVGQVVLMEADAKGIQRIAAKKVITAGVVNGNGRRYPAPVLYAAVQELKGHLHESAGQGRINNQVLGEAEHPTDKNAKRANLLETVVKWTEVNFDGRTVSLGGNILGTSKGKDLQALMEGGVAPGVSLRGYGETKSLKENGENIDEVTALTLTGFDLVLEPSFVDAQAVLESTQNHRLEDETMETKDLEEKLKAEQTAKADLQKQLDEAQKGVKELSERKAAEAVEQAIAEATKELPYGEKNAMFIEAVKAAKPQDVEAVKALVESKRKEYDALFAGEALIKLGFKKDGKITGVAPVLESELGIPEFARGSFQITEAISQKSGRGIFHLNAPKTINERFAAEYLKKFDQQYRHHLMAESKMLQEAEATTDLNLPYSVSRAIVAEVFPTLVATGIFDVAMTDQAPTTNIWYESFSAESGMAANAIAAETRVITALGTWYSLAHKFMNIGSVSVTNNAANVTYVLNTDYVIDYMNGRIMALATIAPGDTVKVTYTYDAIAAGENAAIQQGKQALAYKPLTIGADRLATEISREAIVFSRAALGYDAVAQTLASLARQIGRRIDKGLMYLGLSAALSVATNSGGDWTRAGKNYQDLFEKIGVARAKVANRYYEPTAVICSLTNSDAASNWDGFSNAGMRPDSDLNANGYVGRMKGLGFFESTEMDDGYFLIVNRSLVMHRIFQTLQFRGPFPSYSSNKLVASEQYYVEEFNGSDAPVPGKGAVVAVV